MKGFEVILAKRHGFCGGVTHAIALAESALSGLAPGGRVYCLHDIVHNADVTDRLSSRGMVFVDSLDDVPDGAEVLFSAHGVAPAVREEAARRGMVAIDATCPFVERLHRIVRERADAGCEVVLIGTRGHDETVGVVGEAPGRIHVVENAAEAESLSLRDGAAAVFTQTTLSAALAAPIVEALKKRFPKIDTSGCVGACHVSEERQRDVRGLAAETDIVLVIGSEASANARRLVESARAAGARAALLRGVDEAKGFFAAGGARGARRIGIAAAASTPGDVAEAVADWLRGEAPEKYEGNDEGDANVGN